MKIIINDVEMSLPKKEFSILLLLTSKPEKVFSREEIYRKIWGTDVIVGDRTMDVHIRKLRKKIVGLGIDDVIQSVYGVGCRYQAYIKP